MPQYFRHRVKVTVFVICILRFCVLGIMDRYGLRCKPRNDIEEDRALNWIFVLAVEFDGAVFTDAP